MPARPRHAPILSVIPAIVAGTLLVGCAAAPPSPSATAIVASASPALTPPPSARPVPSAPPSLSPSPTPTAPGPGEAPAGPWTRVDWIAAGDVLPLGPSNVGVYGWSRGYVAVRAIGGDSGDGSGEPFTLTTSSSADGLRWTPARSADVAGLVGGAELGGIVEGPDGLLMFGRPLPDTCGGPPTVSALWTSRDGETWRRVTLPSSFGSNRVATLEGGSAGYIATGLRSDGKTPLIWTSADGARWRVAPLPHVTSGSLLVDGGTSFQGGLVVVGALVGPEGCGGVSSIHPSIWWSRDGTSWTREALAGASTSAHATMSIRRLSDHAVAAFEQTGGDETLQGWVSTDGRTWAPVAKPSGLAAFGLVTDGRHAATIVDPGSESGPPTVATFDDRLVMTTVSQSGDGPVASPDELGWTFAVGPTGVLVTRYDGTAVWLGVPASS